MTTEDDYDEFTAALNAAMTTPAYPATPEEIEALAAEEYQVRNGSPWATAPEQARGEALQWASLMLISPAIQNILRSAQAVALDQASEDIYDEWDRGSKHSEHEERPGVQYAEDWLLARAEQIRNGKR